MKLDDGKYSYLEGIMEEKKNDLFNDQNDHITSEEAYNDADQNNEESLEDFVEKPEAKEKDPFEERKNDDAKKADSSEEAENPAEAGEGMGQAKISPTCSCYSAPSPDSPSFTANASVLTAKQEKNEKKKYGKAIAFLSIGLVLCLVVSFVSGGFAGFVFASLRNDGFSNVGGRDEVVNVIKNDGSIQVNEETGSTGYSNLSVAEVVELVADSVVEITTSQVETDLFYGNYVTSGAGSGVIIAENGYIITNQHVVENADRITVRLRNGQEFPAQLVGGDADVDIAVLKIKVTGLSFAVMGKSSELRVGEEVVAIGNPLGQLGGTVTNGIISATDRRIAVDGHLMTLLQTNAAINPGNSGGGLFDMAGQLIGIVNAKQSETGIEGLGFAIPIDVAYSAAKDIMEYGYVKGKISLGFTVDESTTGFSSGYVRYPAGIYVVETTLGSLSVYDRIVAINGVSINGLSDYYGAIDGLKIGDVIEMTVSRRSGLTFREVRVTITVVEYVP